MHRHVLLAIVTVSLFLGVGASSAVAAPSIPWATQSVALNSASEADTEAISTLADGSAIVTGLFKGTVAFGSTSLTSAGDNDIYVAKVDASGSYVWAIRAGSTGWDGGYGVSTLADGSAIVTGQFAGTVVFGSTSLTASGSDVFVAKVNSSGSFVWAARAGGSSTDKAWYVSTLADGSAIFEGYFKGTAAFGATTLTSAGRQDYFVAKVTAAGAFVWATRAGGSGDDGDESWGVSTLVDGSAIVTGSFEETADFGATSLTSAGNLDVFIAKVDGSGAFLWAIRAGGSAKDRGWDVGTLPDGSALAVGPFAGTAVFGSTTLSSVDYDAYVAKVVSPSAAPGSVTATAGSGQANVSWEVPVYSGGAAITSYSATASPGGGTCTATAPATSCTITGLTNGTSYTFTVTATNATGTSPASAPSNAVTPTTMTAATTTTATATSTEIEVVVLPGRTRLRSGETMRIAIRASNSSKAAVASVTTCLTLPANLVVHTGGAQRAGRSLCFSLGSLAAGATRTRAVHVRAVTQRTVTRRVIGTARSSTTSASLTTARSTPIRITPRVTPAETVTG